MKSIRLTIFLVAVALTLLLAREFQAAEPSPIKISTAATSRDYLWTMIACDEKEEATISDAFNAFVTLLATGELKKEELRFPARLATRHGGAFYLTRAFYLTPNELRGFELVIPEAGLVERNGVLAPVYDLEVVRRGGSQGIVSLVLKKKEPNQSLQPTAPSGRG